MAGRIRITDEGRSAEVATSVLGRSNDVLPATRACYHGIQDEEVPLVRALQDDAAMASVEDGPVVVPCY